MDWAPVVDPCLTGRDLKRFYYNKGRSENTVPPKVFYYKDGDVKSIDLGDDESSGGWADWIENDIFKERHLNNASQNDPDLSGFHVLVSPHLLPVSQNNPSGPLRITTSESALQSHVGAPGQATEPVPRSHQSLPFSEERWKQIVNVFMIPKVIVHKDRRSKCQSTFVACRHKGLDMELHTAVAAPFNRSGSFTFSCTYFCAPRLSLAVFYSCDSTQTEYIGRLLGASREAASHPLLMVGVFAELQLRRMLGLLRDVHKFCDMTIQQFERCWSNRCTSSIRTLNNQLLQGVFKAKEAEEEMRTVRAQLKEMGDRIDDQKKTWQERVDSRRAVVPDGFISLFDRFKCRFREIDMELDGLMAQCRIAAERQSNAGSLFMSELSRQEAVASRRHAGQSTYLAWIATIYLPVTSVAAFFFCLPDLYMVQTIFAVPAFNFENKWVDVRWRPVNDTSGDTNGSSSPSDPPKPVFSGYGIIFIVVSATLTGITYTLWMGRKRQAAKEEEEDKSQQGDPLVLIPEDWAGNQSKVANRDADHGTKSSWLRWLLNIGRRENNKENIELPARQV